MSRLPAALALRCLSLICALALLVGPSLGRADAHEASERFSSLESVQAFDELLKTFAGLRETILSDASTEREAAEGMRFLLRTLAMSSEVSGDGYAPAPHFARMDTPRRKVGGDNPDAEYDNVVWDGNYDYKITGNIGTVDHLSFTVLQREPSGRSRSIGYFNERSAGADANGDFTVWLTKAKPAAAGKWIETSPGEGSILVRQYIGDRAKERLASYEIAVVGREAFAPLPPSTDGEIAQAINSTRYGFQTLSTLHRIVQPALTAEPNAFQRFNSDNFGADISGTDNLYMLARYEIEPGEALIVEVEALDVRYWNFAIESPWHESVDYAKRKGSRTHDDVVVDADGKLRFVVAHARSAHPNYLETAGHRRGFMTFRWVGERETEAPLPKITRLPLAKALEQARKLGGR